MSADAIPASAPPAGDAVRPLRDFGDWMSPMLVKELRTGLKSPFFVWGSILVQLILAVISLTTAGSDGSADGLGLVFWWCLAAPVCLLLPLRLSNALREEMSGHTMDTLVLTRLSAWRIVLGKWVATAALQVLVVMTVLPYLILRYFAGGIDIPMELLWLAIFLLLGLCSSAILLGLSFLGLFLLRAAVLLGVVIPAFSFVTVCIFMISRQRYGLEDLHGDIGTAGIFYFLVLILWGIFFFLDLGASQIAPDSENRSTPRRLAALAMLVSASALSFFSKENDIREAGCFGAAAVALLAVIQAVSEQPRALRPVLQPFTRGGFLGGLAGRVLAPGWHTGLVFGLVVTTLALAGGAIVVTQSGFLGGTNRDEQLALFLGMLLLMCIGAVGILAFPIGLMALMKRLAAWNFWRWLLGSAIGLVFYGIVMAAWGRTEALPVALVSHAWPGAAIFAPAVIEEQAQQGQGSAYYNRPNWWEERRQRTIALLPVFTGTLLLTSTFWTAAAFWCARRHFRNQADVLRDLRAERRAGSPAEIPGTPAP